MFSSKKDFYKYLYNTYDLETLSEEQVLEIGKTFKQELPKSEKRWDELAEIINWDGSGQSLRMFVLNNTDVVYEETTEDNAFKRNQEIRDKLNLYRRYLREDSRIERMEDTIKEVVSTLKPLNYKMTSTYEIDNPHYATEAILMISDLHLGIEVDSFCNKYNLEIARKRLSKLVDKTIKYCKLHQVKRLNVVNLGDLISGIIHVTLRLDQEMDVIQQVIEASELMANVLGRLSSVVPEVIYRSCTDNHSRVISDKTQAIEKENFYRLIDWYLKERLSHTQVRFTDDNVSCELGKFNLLNGKTVMFAHGHNINTNKIFQHFIGATGEYVDYVLLGHFHNERVKNFQNLRVFINGSIIGTDQYAESKGLFTKPTQSLIVFDDDTIVNHSISLDITE